MLGLYCMCFVVDYTHKNLFLLKNKGRMFTNFRATGPCSTESVVLIVIFSNLRRMKTNMRCACKIAVILISVCKWWCLNTWWIILYLYDVTNITRYKELQTFLFTKTEPLIIIVCLTYWITQTYWFIKLDSITSSNICVYIYVFEVSGKEFGAENITGNN